MPGKSGQNLDYGIELEQESAFAGRIMRQRANLNKRRGAEEAAEEGEEEHGEAGCGV